MPKRKQRAQLKTKGSSGQDLARRQRWHSHGVDRQHASGELLEQENQPARLEVDDQQAEDRWEGMAWYARLLEYGHDDRPYEWGRDEVSDLLSSAIVGQRLHNVAPAPLRAQWRKALSSGNRTLDREDLEHRICSPWQEGADIGDQLREHIGPLTNVSIIAGFCDQADVLPMANKLLYYAPFWIRSPHEFENHSLRELIDHLFVRYQVPEVLYRVWMPARPQAFNSKWVQWFLCYAQGGSLHKLGQVSGAWAVGKGFQHAFSAQGESQSIRSAISATELKLLDLDPAVLPLLASFDRYLPDITSPWHHFEQRFLEHWRDTARWLHRYRDDLTIELARYLLQWAFAELRREGDFSWAGRTLEASIQHADEAFLGRHERFVAWSPLASPWSNDAGWSVVELTDTRALTREAVVLEHCVDGYASFCVSGRSAIFSLRYRNQPRVTIEWHRETEKVWQALGHRNRACTTEELNVIDEWLTHLRSSQAESQSP